MLRWALAFFIIALIAALFGFVGIAAAAERVRRQEAQEDLVSKWGHGRLRP